MTSDIHGFHHAGLLTPSYLAAMTIRVADLATARAVVESGDTLTRAAGNGFFISARDACGATLFFTAH